VATDLKFLQSANRITKTISEVYVLRDKLISHHDRSVIPAEEICPTTDLSLYEVSELFQYLRYVLNKYSVMFSSRGITLDHDFSDIYREQIKIHLKNLPPGKYLRLPNDEIFPEIKKLAQAGASRFQNNLGHYYYQGTYGRKNKVLAYKWFIISEELGNSYAYRNRKAIHSELTNDQVVRAQRLAQKWLQDKRR